MPFCALARPRPRSRAPSADGSPTLLRPYVETCIEAFGAEPRDVREQLPGRPWGADYATLWNAFKRIAQGASADEKRALFAGAAARVYAIEDQLP